MSPPPTNKLAEEQAEDFAGRFADFWAAPSPERLGLVLGPDVLLVAPLTPTTRSLEEGQKAFAQLFELIPDLTGEVHRWGGTDDGVLIEFTLSGTVGGGPISWHAVDRFVLGEDGLAAERISYFDPLQIVLTILRRPRALVKFVQVQIRARR